MPWWSLHLAWGHLQGGPTAVMRWEHQQIRQFLDAIGLKLNQQDFVTEEEETSASLGAITDLNLHP